MREPGSSSGPAPLAADESFVTPLGTMSSQRDELTGLLSRTGLDIVGNQQLDACYRSQEEASVLVIDLDRFTRFNTSLSPEVGDAFLRKTSERLQRLSDDMISADLGSAAPLARLGDDEFTLVVSGIAESAVLQDIARRVIHAIAVPLQHNGESYVITASVGVSRFPAHGRDISTLVSNAQIAMRDAKSTNRHGGTYKFFKNAMNEVAMSNLRMEEGLRQALSNSEFHLHYQPQICLEKRKIIGFEALLRWDHPDGRAIPPDMFIPVAEQTGLIIPLGLWVLREACSQTQIWREEGHVDLRMAVNVSSVQFMSDDFINDLQVILDDTGLPPGNLELELTESVIMSHADESVGRLSRLREMGVTLAMDDFGTGYSSLSYLRQFPINTLKIDRSFICDVSKSADADELTRAIVGLARNLNLSVVAEGVETHSQLSFIENLGCSTVQGYLYSPPKGSRFIKGLLLRDYDDFFEHKKAPEGSAAG